MPTVDGPPFNAPPGEPRHIPALDGIRGLAILLVLLFHTGTMLRDPGTGSVIDRVYEQIMNAGWCGVDLFFVLSGFLITGILHGTRARPRYFYNFYGRRILRIFPLYYAFLLVVTVALPIAVELVHKKPGDNHAAVWCWLYLSNYWIAARGSWASGNLLDITWSLSIEEQFYMVWPLLIWLLNRRTMMGVCVAIIAGDLVARVIAVHTGVNVVAIQTLTPMRLDGLATGAWIALAIRGPMPKHHLRRIATAAVAIGITTIAIIIATGGGFSGGGRGVQAFGYSALALLFGGLITFAATPGRSRLVAGVTSVAPLAFLGQYSYALYLLNRPVLSLVRDKMFASVSHHTVMGSQLPVTLAFQAVVIACSLAAALASWHLFEKRFLALKRYFSGPKPPAPCTGLRHG
jgi:peptidoglycan/LPS O-acetylase OafA/YrhL